MNIQHPTSNLQRPTANGAPPTIYIFERGILGWQSIFGDWKNWPNQACVWVNQNTEGKAQTLTYFTGPILAGATRPWRAKQFAKLIEAYRGWRIVLVWHSEGTATGLRALRYAHWPKIAEIHLVCGAADSDFEENGMNRALATGAIGHAYVYVAKRDGAMKLENSYLGSLCFGLQTGGQPLGLSGPTHTTPEADGHITVIEWPDYGHSDCWLPKHFDGTLRAIVTAQTRADARTQPTLFERALGSLSTAENAK